MIAPMLGGCGEGAALHQGLLGGEVGAGVLDELR